MFQKSHALTRILPFATYLGFIFIADILSRLGINGDELRWLYAVKIVAVLAALWWGRQFLSELLVDRINLKQLTAAVLAGIVVLVLWIWLDASWMVIGKSGGFDPRTNGVLDWRLVTIRLVGGALVVPLMEELFWRSFLMRWLVNADFLSVRPAQIGLRSLLVTVLLFGIEHNLWFAGVVAGGVYSLLYMRTNTIWSPIVAHAVTNGLLGIWVLVTGNWAYW